MKELPAFHNCKICNFMIDLTNDCVASYQIDTAYDIKTLYELMLMGEISIYWGVRKCGTGMGHKGSEILKFYKEAKMISLFEFSNLYFINGEIMGDVKMVSYTEPYTNKWYNETGKNQNWYHAGDEFDEFYTQARKITREFLKNSQD